MTCIGGLHQCFAIVNLTLTQHLSEKKNVNEYIYTFNWGNQEHDYNDRKVNTNSTLKRRENRDALVNVLSIDFNVYLSLLVVIY